MTYKFRLFVVCLFGCLLLALWEIQVYYIPYSASKIDPFAPWNSNISANAHVLQTELLGTKDESSSVQDRKHDRYLIYICRLKQKCCGFVDRIRGIAHGFVLAIITGRKFGVHMELPSCELSSMLDVNQVDWRVNVTALEASNLTSQTYNSVRIYNSDIHDFRGYFDKDVVYYTSNQLKFEHGEKAEIEWTRGKSHFEIIGDVFRKLFKLAPPLQKEVDEVMRQVRDRSSPGLLVAAQIRLGRSPLLQVPISQHASLIWTFVTSHLLANPGARLFVASDSNDVILEAREMFGDRLLEVTGPILHVAHEKNKSEVCAGLRRLLLDIHVLAASDVLLVTPSGIGDLASHVMRDRKAKVYCYTSDNNSISQLPRHILCR